MNILITGIIIRNFLSIGNITQTINLALHGLTLVLGENVDVGGGNSRNGVGKTSLLQAISYGLFGEPLTKIKLDNLCNNINNKGMLVIIEFESGGKKYRIERGRKPSVLRYFIDDALSESKGANANTQDDIDKVLGMSHLMFKHIVALNTFTEPFMKLEPSKQRLVIEELLGITQLSQRADALKKLMDDTKDQLKTEEATVKANNEANARIEQAIDRAKADAEIWQRAQNVHIELLQAEAKKRNQVDVDAEIAIFDQIDAWIQQKKEIDVLTQYARQEIDSFSTEIIRLQKEIKRYDAETARVDNGEIARLESQAKRYLTEAEQDITVSLNRLAAEADRRRKEAGGKMELAEKLAQEMIVVQAQIANPDAHNCSTCGQGLAGTDHLQKIMTRLQDRITGFESQIELAMAAADTHTEEADEIEKEINQTKATHANKRVETQNKVEMIRQDIEVARATLVEQQQAAGARAAELRVMVVATQEKLDSNLGIIDEAKNALTEIGIKPVSSYNNRDAVWKIKQERDLLLHQIEAEKTKTNIHVSKIDGLQSTLVALDYEPVNRYNLKLKHEVFLYKLLTAKDSFIRKKIVDQNLMYLNNRMNHFLESLGLPHEVRFLPDLTVEIMLLGKELDFEQLSRGEMNRVILATWWSFRDVWESLNASFNLLFVDECLDFGLDDHGAEAALMVLQGMARDRHKNVFLISHKENLIGRADRVLLVKKEDQFTSFNEDYQLN